MIFVDSNVFMYAVGEPHPLKAQSQEFLAESKRDGTRLFTSAEVLQELLHAYLPVRRLHELAAAVELLLTFNVEVWPLLQEDVRRARQLHEQHPTLQARDLCHLASCDRRGITTIKTFDRALAAAANRNFGNWQ